jgi:hypothetical protein
VVKDILMPSKLSSASSYLVHVEIHIVEGKIEFFFQSRGCIFQIIQRCIYKIERIDVPRLSTKLWMHATVKYGSDTTCNDPGFR